jgi:hypothetical protein
MINKRGGIVAIEPKGRDFGHTASDPSISRKTTL